MTCQFRHIALFGFGLSATACIGVPTVELSNGGDERIVASVTEKTLDCTLDKGETCRFAYPVRLILTRGGDARSYETPRWPDIETRRPFVVREGPFGRLMRLEVNQNGEIFVLIQPAEGAIQRPRSQPEGFPLRPLERRERDMPR